jgi:two-component system, NarL family, nitrate/nitrite response regulator NarL
VNEPSNMQLPDVANGNYSGRPKLLFADDHQVVLDALSFIASPEYEVRSIDNLNSFERVFDEYSPDLVVLDVRMPGGDGFELVERLLKRHPDVKVMFLSMHTEVSYVKKAAAAGALAYVSKRAPMDELMFAIRAVLDGNKYIGSRVEREDSADSEPNLTVRQLEVLRLISQGCSAKEIARTLDISVRTAEVHRAAIMTRLNLHSTAMMTRYALERGLA